MRPSRSFEWLLPGPLPSGALFAAILIAGLITPDLSRPQDPALPSAHAAKKSRRRAAKKKKAEPEPEPLKGLVGDKDDSPPTPKGPPPLGQTLKGLSLPNATGVAALSMAAGEKLPLVKVPAKWVVADARRHCETAWFDFYQGRDKVGYASTGCEVEQYQGNEVLAFHFTLTAPHHNFEYTSKRLFTTRAPGRLIFWEANRVTANKSQKIKLELSGSMWQHEVLEFAGERRTGRKHRRLPKIEENLENGEMALYALLRRGKLKPGARFRYAWFDPEEGSDRRGALQLLQSTTHDFGSGKIPVHKAEMLLLHSKKRVELYLDATARLLVGKQEGAMRIRNTEAAAKDVPKVSGRKKKKDEGLLGWILSNLGLVLGIGITLIVVASTSIIPFLKKAAKSGGSPAKRKGVGAGLARHLLKRKWTVGSNSDSLWSFEEDEEKNRDLNLKDQAAMAEIYNDYGLFGYVNQYFCKVARERWDDENPQLQIEVQLYWDNHSTNPKVDLRLKVKQSDSSAGSGRQSFATGNPGFDGFFNTRHANAQVVQRLTANAANLNFVGEFAAKWGNDIAELELSDTIEAKFYERIFVKAEDPKARLDELLGDLTRLAGAIETSIDPSFVAKPPPSMEGPRYVAMEVITTCPKCRSGLPLNGPMLDIKCPSCMSEFTLVDDFWDLLEDPDKNFRKGQGGFNRNMDTDFRWRVARPKCMKCGEELPVDDIPVGADNPVFCPACGTQNVTFPAPDWLKGVVPAVEQIYGAERDGQSGSGPAMQVNQQAARPIAMACPQCGGALTVTADMERTIRCGYCQVDVFLPDELWKQLHPVKTSAAWYARFSPK